MVVYRKNRDGYLIFECDRMLNGVILSDLLESIAKEFLNHDDKDLVIFFGGGGGLRVGPIVQEEYREFSHSFQLGLPARVTIEQLKDTAKRLPSFDASKTIVFYADYGKLFLSLKKE